MGQWYRNTVPKCKEKTCSDDTLVTIEVQGYQGETYKRVVRAVYIPYHHCTVEDMGWNMYDGVPDSWEYAEEQASWWIPQGWYEVCDYFDEYQYYEIEDEVVAWMKMPKPYEPRLKKLN